MIRRWEAGLNLIASNISVSRESHTILFEIQNRGRNLNPDEERRCKVRISYPPNQTLTVDLSQFDKHQTGNWTYYLFEITNIFEGGVFRLEVDVDNVFFETNENDNIKTVNINTKDLTLLHITSPNTSLTVTSGSSVNLGWQYSPPQGYSPGGGFTFYYEILDSSGNKVLGTTPIYNAPTVGSYSIKMPYNLGIYRIKLLINDFYGSYDISAPVNVTAATIPPNPPGFRITSTLPSVIRNGETITFSWEVDLNKYSEINVEILRPDLSRIYYIPYLTGFRSPTGNSSFNINIQPVEFEAGRKDIILRFGLKRKNTPPEFDYYYTSVIQVLE